MKSVALEWKSVAWENAALNMKINIEVEGLFWSVLLYFKMRF